MSILVTGGAGFVGSHFIERLLRNGHAKIVCLDNFNDYYDPRLKRSNVAAFGDNPRVSIVEGDFCDGPAMKRLLVLHGVQHVVHLGAYAGVHASIQQPAVYQQVNVGGTLALLEAARHHPLESFLLVSSSTVYGRGTKVPFREDAPLGVPASPYGATKRAAELLGLTYHGLFGVPVICLRPFSVYGPRLRPDLAMSIFTSKILRGEPVPLYGDGSIRRDFTHVHDICAGLVAALGAVQAIGEEINLGHSSPIPMRELIGLLEQATGKRALIDQQQARDEDLPITFASLEKAERLLDYRPRVSLEQGIPEYVAWHRQWYGL
jgi:UDP-glucuronate 4-epimerase